jgi:hypothetical protein
MQLTRRKSGSQRTSKMVPFEFAPNFVGQGGTPTLTLHLTESDEYITLYFDNLEEGKRLLSEAHITYHNVVDELHKEETIAALTSQFGRR